MQTLMAAITPAQIPKEELSQEELREFEARAKEYSRLKMAQHRAWQEDLNNKIRLKRAALAALPAGYLRDAAMVEDHAMFPLVGTGVNSWVSGTFRNGTCFFTSHVRALHLVYGGEKKGGVTER